MFYDKDEQTRNRRKRMDGTTTKRNMPPKLKKKGDNKMSWSTLIDEAKKRAKEKAAEQA